ncbi:TadE-like protein [Symmachiella macrocystis]|uniref:TadE-like protein n=2 Tax=Symmachiella macrocystis TaxID=2527985 RepID=A0A5C6BM78_9PLAN|nr:TadE-like protein [Symmachiella macrocystis]
MKSIFARKGFSERRGVAAVEMALVAPLFMLLVLGIIEFGRYLMVGQLVVNAAREGTRMAISGYFTEEEVRTDVETFVTEAIGLDPEDVTIEIDTASGETIYDAEAKDLITIRVAVRFVDVTYLPILGEGGGGEDDPFVGLRENHDDAKWISGISSMRKE